MRRELPTKKKNPGRAKILSSGAGWAGWTDNARSLDGSDPATSSPIETSKEAAAADSASASRSSVPRQSSISCCVRTISLFSLSSESLLCSRSGCSPGRLPAACLIAFQLRATSTSGCEPFRVLLCCAIPTCNQRANSSAELPKRHAAGFAPLAAPPARRELPRSPGDPAEPINFSTPSWNIQHPCSLCDPLVSRRRGRHRIVELLVK